MSGRPPPPCPPSTATAAVALCNGAVPYLEPKAPEDISAFVVGISRMFMTGVLGS